MVAGRDSSGRLLGDCGLDQYLAAGSRPGRAQHRGAKDTVLDKTQIAVDGRDVTFAADAFSEDGRRNAVASVEAVPGVRLVNDETRLVPEAKPFVWSAERDVVRVTLGGSAPLPASKSKLLEAARAALGGVEVADQMDLARGAPPRFDDAALLLLDQIGKAEGRQDHASPTPRSAFPAWRATSAAAKRSPPALKNLPEGFSVAANEIKAPPYIFQAYKDPVAVTLTLTGYVPDNNVHAALVAAAGAQILQRKGRRQSQGQHRRARRIRRRGGAGAGRAVAAVDRHAGGVRPRGEAVGRCVL